MYYLWKQEGVNLEVHTRAALLFSITQDTQGNQPYKKHWYALQ